MADEEDQIVCADCAYSTATSEVRCSFELMTSGLLQACSDDRLTISMTCCWTMPSIMLVVSGDTSPVSPDTNIICIDKVSLRLQREIKDCAECDSGWCIWRAKYR